MRHSRNGYDCPSDSLIGAKIVTRMEMIELHADLRSSSTGVQMQEQGALAECMDSNEKLPQDRHGDRCH